MADEEKFDIKQYRKEIKKSLQRAEELRFELEKQTALSELIVEKRNRILQRNTFYENNFLPKTKFFNSKGGKKE